MERKPWQYQLLAIALSLVSGALFALALPPRNISLLGWIAFLPLLAGTRLTNRVVIAAFCGMLVSITCALVLSGKWENLAQYGNLVAAFGGLALVFAFVAAFSCFGAKRLSPGLWAVFVTLAAVTAELLSAHVFPVNVAICQHHNPLALRLASITGIWGVSALLWLVPATTLALARGAKSSWPAVALLSLLLVAGLVPQPRNTGRKVGVAAIQAEDLDDTRLQTLKAARQARIVVWPEYVSTTRNHIAYDTARKARVYIVASYQEDVPNGRPHNVAHLISSRGKLLGLFRKQHLFGREKFVFARGNPRLPIGVDGLKVGVPICYDTQIPDVSRRLARDGANLLMVPNSDPWMPNGLFGYLHSAIIPFRAAENGIPIAWSEHSGLSTIIDGDGSTLAQAPLHTVGYAAARVTPRSRRTFYTMAGDYFAYMCAGGLVVVVVLCWKPRGDN